MADCLAFCETAEYSRFFEDEMGNLINEVAEPGSISFANDVFVERFESIPEESIFELIWVSSHRPIIQVKTRGRARV